MTRDEAIGRVRRALDETEAEYAMLPLIVRLLVRRGFVKRTGRDFAAWRALLASGSPGLASALGLLAEHYRGAHERAKRGRGATDAQLAEIERRSRARAEDVAALRALI